MNYIQPFLITILSIFFIACSGAEEDDGSSSDSFTLTADAGEDKRVLINETVIIRGEGKTTDNSELSYLWEKERDTLATTASFSYTPTVVGTDTLRFIVQHNNGAVITDTMNVVVTDREVLSFVPKIKKELKEDYLNAVNKARSSSHTCGEKGLFPATTPLAWSDKLYKSSYEHTQDLIKSETFSHLGSGTKSDWTGYILHKQSNFQERIETYGYKWKYIGENLGGGTVIDTPKEMVDGWLESDNHCVNLMSPNFTEMGMVMIKDETSLYTHYWTQNFGTPR